MKDEADARKETIAKAFAVVGLHVTIYDAGCRYRTQVQARAACLRALINDLAGAEVDTLIVLDEDETLVHSDRQLLYHAVRALGVDGTLRYAHRRAAAERLLGIPDAFACAGQRAAAGEVTYGQQSRRRTCKSV